ncbi:hypothetical protein [Streptomyces sp. SID3343]|uniref:hypothetical protein n=1 Tax=Streptomyces sp. SID3343 TaxID=2690260 RepID=UPI00136B44FF|nr:hypothetical protein [Streptomyces sp. SID3343]MYW04532.1 hypothetical protein [Streptomyces sp. SID3343]
MSKIKSATIAAACAIGATAAMVTPASAAGTAKATYDCGIYGSSVGVTFTRSATNLLTLTASLTYFVPTAIPVGGITGTLTGNQSGLANPTAISAGFHTSIVLQKAGSAGIPGAPGSVVMTITPPGLTVTCTLKASPPPTGFPI